jgi:hypothetical protein
MKEDAHLTAAKDRFGRFSGSYRCSLCNAEFRPNPKNLQEISNFFAAHVMYAHPASGQDLNQGRLTDCEGSEGSLMNKGFERVLIRFDDYIADLLDREVSFISPGFEGTVEILREQARSFRESDRTETLTISKQVTDK